MNKDDFRMIETGLNILSQYKLGKVSHAKAMGDLIVIGFEMDEAKKLTNQIEKIFNA